MYRRRNRFDVLTQDADSWLRLMSEAVTNILRECTQDSVGLKITELRTTLLHLLALSHDQVIKRNTPSPLSDCDYSLPGRCSEYWVLLVAMLYYASAPECSFHSIVI